ncbi:MAG: 6-carboxytetrahydropterin synthase QueD [Bacteroidetes bacterium]|nr:6-carboxytetrahydropterin synthase QueD [Bacteroidota bacterium]
MDTFRISKTFTWEMGHRLPYHNRGCQNIHGHSYEMEIILEGTKNDQGMVLDYDDLKTAVKHIIDKWDHSFLVDDKDELVRDFLKSSSMKHVVFKGYTTAENIAHYICEVLRNILSIHKNLKAIEVVVRETRSSEAIARRLF